MIDFDQMVDEVERWLNETPEHAREAFKKVSEDELVMFHSSVGRRIRNHFRLWEVGHEPQIDDRGVDCAPDHPDQISMNVIKAVWQRANS